MNNCKDIKRLSTEVSKNKFFFSRYHFPFSNIKKIINFQKSTEESDSEKDASYSSDTDDTTDTTDEEISVKQK